MGNLDLGICGSPSPWTIPPCCSALWAPVICPTHPQSGGVVLELRVKDRIAQVGFLLSCLFREKAWEELMVSSDQHQSMHHCTADIRDRNLAFIPAGPTLCIEHCKKYMESTSRNS